MPTTMSATDHSGALSATGWTIAKLNVPEMHDALVSAAHRTGWSSDAFAARSTPATKPIEV